VLTSEDVRTCPEISGCESSSGRDDEPLAGDAVGDRFAGVVKSDQEQARGRAGVLGEAPERLAGLSLVVERGDEVAVVKDRERDARIVPAGWRRPSSSDNANDALDQALRHAPDRPVTGRAGVRAAEAKPRSQLDLDDVRADAVRAAAGDPPNEGGILEQCHGDSERGSNCDIAGVAIG
jgi:hypothetical protein